MRIYTFGSPRLPVWVPEDSGFKFAVGDLADNSNNGTLTTSGTVYVIKDKAIRRTTVSNIWGHIAAAGSVLTAGQCFAGIYQFGARLGITADQAASWVSTGLKQMAIVGAPITVEPGDVYFALLFNGTTGPGFTRSNQNTGTLINGNLAAAASRFGVANTGQTSLPATLGPITAQSNHAWILAAS